MPDADSRRSTRVHPSAYIPLALGLAGYAAPMAVTSAYAPVPVPGGAGPSVTYAKVATCDPEPIDADECHATFPTGCSDSDRPKYDAYLNLLKNWTEFPSGGTIRYIDETDVADLETHTPEALTSRNHAQHAEALRQLGEGKIRGVVGYLYYGFPTGAETSNCKLTGTDNVDFHIGIGFDADLADRAQKALATSKKDYEDLKKKRLEPAAMIVEMTPHDRATGWTADRLAKAIGRKVRVQGQLLIDNEHANPAQNCGYAHAQAGPKCWRLSAWEFHPVTSFEVCSSGECTKSSGQWADLSTVQ